jgi:multidrug transporter EmrE-like cation transporter
MNIKFVIFDLDGVLVEAKEIHYEALNEALGEKYMITWDEHLSRYDGLKTSQKLEMLTKDKGLPVELYDEVWMNKQKLTIEKLRNLSQSEQLIECMSSLTNDDYKIAVCSNSIRKTVLTVLSKLGMDSYEEKLPTLHAVWIRLLFAFGAAFFIAIVTGRMKANSMPVFKNQNNGLPFMFLGTLFGPVLGVSFSLLAIQHLSVATAQTIFALLPIVVLPINYFYYKEKITIQAIFACAIAVLGVFVLIWRDSINLWI